MPPRRPPTPNADTETDSETDPDDEAPSSSRRRVRPQLRERAVREGLESFGDKDLLAVLLEHGTKNEPLEARVERLWQEGGGLSGIASRGVGSLMKDLGLGPAAAARVGVSIELATRIARLARDPSLTPARTSDEVESWARARLVALPHEELWALLLDGRNRILAERQLARGGLHALAISARDVLRTVVREAASAFVLVHNHPSGDPCPSREDIAFTKAIAAAADIVGIALLDHVIVARDGCLSMLHAGLFPPSVTKSVTKSPGK